MKVLEAAGFAELRLEPDLYYLHGLDGFEAIAHTHVDDFLIAFRKASQGIQRWADASCAHASSEATDWHGVLWLDHCQRGQPHER